MEAAETRSILTIALLAAFLIGFAAGAELDIMAFLTAKYFGLKHYGQIYAVFYAGLAIAGGIAPLGFAAFFDATGSYDAAFLAASGLFAAGALSLLTLGRYPDPALWQNDEATVATTSI